MRATIASLALATAATALQACGYPLPAPPIAAAKPPTGNHATAAEADRDRAEQLVRAKFAGEGGNVSQVELYPAEKPHAFSYACYYGKPEHGQLCLYTARGQVDLDTGELTARRHLDPSFFLMLFSGGKLLKLCQHPPRPPRK